MESVPSGMKLPDPRNQETPVSGQCVHIVIIWHLSLRALIDCTQRCGLGYGHFNLTGNGQTLGLVISAQTLK